MERTEQYTKFQIQTNGAEFKALGYRWDVMQNEGIWEGIRFLVDNSNTWNRREDEFSKRSTVKKLIERDFGARAKIEKAPWLVAPEDKEKSGLLLNLRENLWEYFLVSGVALFFIALFVAICVHGLSKCP